MLGRGDGRAEDRGRPAARIADVGAGPGLLDPSGDDLGAGPGRVHHVAEVVLAEVAALRGPHPGEVDLQRDALAVGRGEELVLAHPLDPPGEARPVEEVPQALLVGPVGGGGHAEDHRDRVDLSDRLDHLPIEAVADRVVDLVDDDEIDVGEREFVDAPPADEIPDLSAALASRAVRPRLELLGLPGRPAVLADDRAPDRA